MDELKIYSRKELCELLGRCIKGVDKLIESGELVKVPLAGHRYGVPAWSVREWQEKYRKESAKRQMEIEMLKMMEVK